MAKHDVIEHHYDYKTGQWWTVNRGYVTNINREAEQLAKRRKAAKDGTGKPMATTLAHWTIGNKRTVVAQTAIELYRRQHEHDVHAGCGHLESEHENYDADGNHQPVERLAVTKHVCPVECENPACPKSSTAVLLTAAEAKLLLHRLDVPDAISEVLEENDDLTSYEIGGAIESLYQWVTTRSLPADLSPVQLAVLEDVLDGSTYLGSAVGSVTPAVMRRLNKVADDLEEKLAPLFGHRVLIPRR